MAIPLTEQDLRILGYTDVKLTTPSDQPGWTAYQAAGAVGLDKIHATYVYVKGDCTPDQLGGAARFSAGKENIYVVAPKSTNLSGARISRAFPRSARHFMLEDLIWERLLFLFKDYVEALKVKVPVEPYFVTPRRVGAPKEDLERDLVSFFQGRSPIPSGQLVVVTAPAGVGKTTLARQVVLSLSTRVNQLHTIPVYVEEKHWSKLRLESLSALWEVIQNSLNAFVAQPPLPEELFSHALSRGHIAFIFDGFDELCGHQNTSFDANSVLQELADIAKASDARIAITTRTLFWDQAITNPPANVTKIPLAEFVRQQAVDYFEKVFKNEPKLKTRARSLYAEVTKESGRPPTRGGGRAQFVNLPYCVVIVADLVRGELPTTEEREARSVVERLVLQLCRREQVRQKLRGTAEEQLSAFEELVTDVSLIEEQNPEFDLEDLVVCGLQQEDLGGLRQHGLLTASGGRFKFKYEFLPSFFRALYLSKNILSPMSGRPDKLWEAMQGEANGNGFIQEHLFELLEDAHWREPLTATLAAVPHRYSEARSFLLHLALNLINKDEAITKEHRTKELFSLLGNDYTERREIRKLALRGSWTGLSLDRLRFVDCTFAEVGFPQTEAGPATEFVRCTFRGHLDIPRTKAWAQVKLSSCRLESPTNLIWEAVLGAVPGSRDELILDAIDYGLRKFWHNGYLKENIKRTDWMKGSLQQSRYRDALLECLLKRAVIMEAVTSGVSEGVYRFNRVHIQALQRFMDGRQLTGIFRELFECVAKKT